MAAAAGTRQRLPAPKEMGGRPVWIRPATQGPLRGLSVLYIPNQCEPADPVTEL